MKIHQDLLATCGDADVDDVRIGVNFSIVVAGGCGLSSTLRGACPGGHGATFPLAGKLRTMSAKELAHLAASENVLEASVGMAALNASLPVPDSRCRDENAGTVLERRAEGRCVVVIGNFPFVPALRETAGELFVFDQGQQGQTGLSDMQDMQATLRRAQVAAVSGTTLINGTFDEVMGALPEDCFKVMLGPTTPLSPLLFEYGMDVVSGVIVSDVSRALQDVSEGASFRQIRGVRRVSMSR